MTLTIQGEVERVTFENEETGFRVLRLGQVTGELPKRRQTLVGIMPAVGVGTRVRATGELQTSRRHGERFVVQSLAVVAPDTQEGLEKYLQSGVVRGVGPAFAKRIVSYFGLETLRVLDDEPHRLLEVPGLGKGRAEEIRSSWSEHRALSNTLLVLQTHGASPSLASKIVQRFGDKAAETVEQRPYRLALEVPGVGFKTADRIARARGLALDHPERVQAGVVHQLRTLAESGHCRAERGLLQARCAEMLSVETAHVDAAMDSLWANESLVVEGEFVYLAKLHAAEVDVAARLAALSRAPSSSLNDWQQRLARFESESGLRLADAQRRAIEAVANQKLVVVTGGPGVGKTTLVRAVLHVMVNPGVRVALCAPTGRAAKRLSESTGHAARTLHRLLEVGGGGKQFGRNAERPLECDLLIVDEASMLDLHLARCLIEAIPAAARVVFVGDVDQLPSVGPGAFLGDLIESGIVPVARLDFIFRQGSESRIVTSSHAILGGEVPQGAETPDGDFFVLHAKSPERAAEMVVTMVQDRIPARFGLDPVRDVQVLCPMHRGEAGTRQLNERLQDVLNPSGAALEHGDGQLRVGDKAIQQKNDYERGVFNGDLGEITSIDAEARSVRVRFEDDEGVRAVDYEAADVSQLALAYAKSIHKSQGSEYPAVVVVLLSTHFVMLSRNLLYTAVTRAKRLCVLVTDQRALSLALSETRKELRSTGLAEKLQQQARTPSHS